MAQITQILLAFGELLPQPKICEIREICVKQKTPQAKQTNLRDNE